MDLATIRLNLAADLAATGIKVSLEPRKAQAPCILIGPVVRVKSGGLCVYEVEVPVMLIAPAPGDAKAVDWLAEHITSVMEACGAEVEAALGSYDVGQGNLPAYQIDCTIYAKE